MMYLASPYTGTPTEQRDRYHAALRASAELAEIGHHVISPIVLGHTVEQAMIEDERELWTHQQWLDWSMALLCRCSQLVVMDTMAGWAESKGVRGEIVAAERMRIPQLWYSQRLHWGRS